MNSANRLPTASILRASGAALLASLLVVSACAPDSRRAPAESSEPHAGERPGEPQPAALAPGTPTSAPDIRDVLASTGQFDFAVALIVGMYQSNAPLERYRLYHLSEDEFAALPPDERARLKREMLSRLSQLRRFAGDLAQQGELAITGKRKDFDLARMYYEIVRNIGEANSGPEVTLLADTIGRELLKLAESGLAKVEAARAAASED